MKKLNDVLDNYIKVYYDDGLYAQLKTFRIEWGQKSTDYIDFLGNNLTGVNPIRFSIQDDRNLMEMLGIHGDQNIHLQQDIYKLPGIDKNFKVSSNYVYITLIYLMYKFINSKHINKLYKEDVLKEIYFIFAYKAFSSLLSNYFKYNINESTARAVVERMTNKSLIKKLHSWQAVFDYRSRDVCSEKGLHYKKLMYLNTFEAVKIINDLQGKLRDMLKNIYSTLLDVVERNDKLKSVNILTSGEDGSEEYGSLTDRQDKYIAYINSIIGIPTDFIRNDIIELITLQLRLISPEELYAILHYFSVNKDIKDKDYIIEASITISLEFLTLKKITTDYIRRSSEVLVLLKSYYNAGNISSIPLKKLKKRVGQFLASETRGLKPKFIAAMTTAFILYIALRALLVKN